MKEKRNFDGEGAGAERTATIQSARRPTAVEAFFDMSARKRSQIMGNARKNGAPTRACHQFPWSPGTRSVTASKGEVPTANGRNTATPATSQTVSAATVCHTGGRRSSIAVIGPVAGAMEFSDD